VWLAWLTRSLERGAVLGSAAGHFSENSRALS
jgi:hypothetical protein